MAVRPVGRRQVVSDEEDCGEDCDCCVSEVEVLTVLRECLYVAPPPELRARIILRIARECGRTE